MTKYNTGNPVGSSSPLDLYDNAENLDSGINGADPTWRDRRGVERRSWTGIEAEFDQFIADNGLKRYSSWAALAADTSRPDGFAADVIGDTGFHTDPITGQSVTNSGQFRSSGGAWQWMRADSIESINDRIRLTPDTEKTLSVFQALSKTGGPGFYVDRTTGELVASANFFYAYSAITGQESAIKVTASLSQPVQALAVYKDGNGAYLGFEVMGTSTETLYQDYELKAVPAEARAIYVSSRRNNIEINASYIAAGVAQRLTTAERNAQESAASLADLTRQSTTDVPGYYIDKSTGAAVASSAYNYSSLPLNGDEGFVYFTTFVTGTTTTPLAFFGEGGALISIVGAVGTQYTDERVAVPPAARSVAVTARSGNPIIIKLEQVSPDVAKRLAVLEASSSSSLSRWRDQAVASFGDSLVGQGRWQQVVVSEHGIVHTNCGVGGSKVAKPDSGPQAVSMCDQARIDAIPAGSVAVLFEGGTNDWAQSVPLGEFTSTAETEFYGALHSTIGKLLTRFPQARIFCITSPYAERITVPGDWANGWTNAIGLTVRAYAEATRRVAEHYGLPVIEWSRECGWSHSNVAQFLDNDGAYFHPSVAAGAPLLGRIVNGRLWDIQR